MIAEKTKTLGVVSFITLAALQVNSQTSKLPNILICMADDVSYPYMGAYGCQWVKTPNSDSIANQGIIFRNAYTPNAKSAPSRSCLLTGLNSWQLEAACNHVPHFPAKFKTFTEVLAENGYFVGLTGKGWAPGDPGTINGKPRQLIGVPFDKYQYPVPITTGISTNNYAENFDDFLNNRPSDKPFFFWFGSLEPHRGYEYGSGIRLGNYKTADISKVPLYWPDNEVVRTDMLDFAFELEHFDTHIGKMIRSLKQRGLLDNTIVIITADNGMPFPRVKGQAYYDSNHLPLIIMWKKGIKYIKREITDHVNFIDIAPTILEIAKISEGKTGMQPIQGKSILPVLLSDKETVDKTRDHVLIGKERHDVGRPNDVGYPIRGIIKGNFIYLYNFKTDRWPAGNPETGYLNCDGGATKSEILNGKNNPQLFRFWELNFGKRPAEELYNTDNDPYCITNLADNPLYKKIKSKLKSQLFSELKKQKDPRILGNGDIFDNYPYADVEDINFYQRFIENKIKRFPTWISPTDVDYEALEKIREK